MSATAIDAPRYLVMTIVDEPQGVAEDRGFKTAAWNAAPIAGRIIEQVAPLLGVPARHFDTAGDSKQNASGIADRSGILP